MKTSQNAPIPSWKMQPIPMMIWGLDGFIVQIDEHDHLALLRAMKTKMMWNDENAIKTDEEEINEGNW
jgi:hypothetical protein